MARRFVTQQGPQFARTGGFFFSRATCAISNLFASSGAKVSRVGNSVLPLGGRLFPFFLEGELHVHSKRSQHVSSHRRFARRRVRAATFDRAETCHVRAAPRAEATRRSRQSDALDRFRVRPYTPS